MAPSVPLCGLISLIRDAIFFDFNNCYELCVIIKRERRFDSMTSAEIETAKKNNYGKVSDNNEGSVEEHNHVRVMRQRRLR